MALAPSSPTLLQSRVYSLPSPAETCCASEGSEPACYQPTLAATTYHLTPPYSNLDSCPTSQTIESNDPLPPLGAMAPISWTTPGSTANAPTSTSTMPDIISAEYNSYVGYGACLSESYAAQETYSLPPSQHSTLSISHSPSTAHSSRSTPCYSPRSSFEYVQGPANGNRTKVEDSATYNSVLDMTPYTAPGNLAPSYSTNESYYSPGFSLYVANNSGAVWSRQEYGTPQFQLSPQYHTVDLEQDRRPSKVEKSRRPSRRHTTKEEANFQCQVKGCGKFFSRSYNFKSHMETHDEKRGYPFPCQTDGCSKRFVRKTDLQRHHQSVHMKERNHKCDYCSRLFARKDTLRRHMEDGCSKRFDIGTLDLHQDGYSHIDTRPRSSRTGMVGLPTCPSAIPPIVISTVPRSLPLRSTGPSYGGLGDTHAWHA